MVPNCPESIREPAIFRISSELKLHGKKDPRGDGFRLPLRRLEVPLANNVACSSVKVGVPGRAFDDDLAHAAIGEHVYLQLNSALNAESPGGRRIARMHLVATA
jgi:hypothetical protein